MKQANKSENYFESGLKLLSISLVGLVLGIFIVLILESQLALSEFGFFSFLTSSDWTPNYDEVGGGLGSLSFSIGTLLISVVAIIISLPFSISISIFLGNFFPKGKISSLLTSLIELLAGIPSVIYGFWAIFYLVPLVEKLKLHFNLGDNGYGLFTASLVLSIMIIPYTASLAKEVISMVPQGLKESAYALGATRLEVIKDLVLPYCRSGIFAGVILALGRALGETMAVTMVVGNLNEIPSSLFDLGNTMASLLANEFNEASDDVYVSALVEIALILFIITTIINFIGKYTLKKLQHT